MDSLEPGNLLARRYRLIDRIGVGGMSVIWRAHDEMLDRSVAVKVLAADLAADSRCRDLVRTEARAAAALVHPHATATYDYGETVCLDGDVTAYVVMELLEGEPLSARLTEGPLPWPEALRVCSEVAEALAAAHRHGIVHRDVTTDNVMLTNDGAKVLDFGIATTVGAPDEDAEGLTFGTPAYVAPERLDGRRARPANDTYALGVLLYESLTGSPPYPAETWEELAQTPLGDPPPLKVPGLPEPVADLARRCLALDPQHRPTAHQVAWTLHRYLPGSRRTGLRQLRFRRSLTAVGAAAAVGLGVLLGATLLRGPGTEAAPEAAPAPTHATGAEPGGQTAGPTSDPAPTDPATNPEPADPFVAEEPPPGPGPGPGPDDADRAGDGAGADPDGVLTGSTSEVTLDTVHDLVTDGHAQGDIQTHVAQDLHQMIENSQRNIETGSMDLDTAVTQLRDKVQTRESEGTLGTASASELYSALDELAAQG